MIQIKYKSLRIIKHLPRLKKKIQKSKKLLNNNYKSFKELKLIKRKEIKVKIVKNKVIKVKKKVIKMIKIKMKKIKKSLK
jgi:hypothetical protein